MEDGCGDPRRKGTAPGTGFAIGRELIQTKLTLKPYYLSMSWCNPSQQLSPTQLLAHSSPGGLGERIRRAKVRKLVG